MFALRPFFFPLLARIIILPEDLEWFHADRSRRFGMPLDQVEAQMGGNVAWEKAEAGFKLMGEVLRKHKRDEGPYILGSVPSYGDLIIASAVQFFKALGEEHFERMVAHDEAIRGVWEACRKWLERDDH